MPRYSVQYATIQVITCTAGSWGLVFCSTVNIYQDDTYQPFILTRGVAVIKFSFGVYLLYFIGAELLNFRLLSLIVLSACLNDEIKIAFRIR